MKTLSVAAIKNGTVIDHINAGQALKIIRILNLPDRAKTVTVGLNLPSKTKKIKDLVKVEDRELTAEDVNKVAVLSPSATINIIRNYQVAKKIKVEIPETIEHVIVCPNPKCVTNNDNADTIFRVLSRNSQLKLKCHYCEKIFKQDEILEYKNN